MQIFVAISAWLRRINAVLFAALVFSQFLQTNVFAVSVSSQPSDTVASVGQSVSFNLVASSSGGSASYTWSKDGVQLANTASTLTISSVASSDAGTYGCTAKDSVSTYLCTSFTLTVDNAVSLAAASVIPAAITTQPINRTVTAGSPVKLTAAATGTDLSYQWYFKGSAISGATKTYLWMATTSAATAGSYYVVVKNSAATVKSTTVTLTVVDPIEISTQPIDRAIEEGNPVKLFVVASGTGTLTYQWFYNGAELSGATKSGLYISSVSTSNAGSYSVVVSDDYSSLQSSTAKLSVIKPVAISASPSSQVVNEGSSAAFSVTASGTGPLSYAWYFNGAPISGATSSSFKIADVSTSDAGKYSVVVSNSISSVTSSSATLAVLATAQSYSASLTWSRPTKREDGTTLYSSEISGFNIYYATSSTGSMTRISSLASSQLSYVVNNLSTGSHYFALSTVDSDGVESSLSTRAKVSF